jgi:hypothetical protein
MLLVLTQHIELLFRLILWTVYKTRQDRPLQVQRNLFFSRDKYHRQVFVFVSKMWAGEFHHEDVGRYVERNLTHHPRTPQVQPQKRIANSKQKERKVNFKQKTWPRFLRTQLVVKFHCTLRLIWPYSWFKSRYQNESWMHLILSMITTWIFWIGQKITCSLWHLALTSICGTLKMVRRQSLCITSNFRTSPVQ